MILTHEDFSVNLAYSTEFIATYTVKCLVAGWAEKDVIAFSRGINQPTRQYLIEQYIAGNQHIILKTIYLKLGGSTNEIQESNNQYGSHLYPIRRRAQKALENFSWPR